MSARGGKRVGAGRKAKRPIVRLGAVPKSVAEQVLGKIDAKKYYLALLPKLDDKGELSGLTQEQKHFTLDILTRLENRVFGRPAQSVIGFDGDRDIDPADVAARRDRVRQILASLTGKAKR